jgi:uncharacterized protein YyaL (SSP411 family)
MTHPLSRNRLEDEASPYLRQHADNPVHWQPWDDAALSAAQEQDRPIFLSVGYSACHWCHVMADESFEDDEVAAVLNESFVPIKVDREERPDLDRVYQTICGLVTGGGGWPLSAWLTPEGKPFYVGTYFPKTAGARRGNAPGFLDICRSFASSWDSDRDEIENRGQQWTDALRDRLETTPTSAGGAGSEGTTDGAGEADADSDNVGADSLGSVVTAAIRASDREYGGFGSGGPKFPQPWRIDALLRASAAAEGGDALPAATASLDAMAAGGVYDHLGGGFHRYATDREWTVPHFEKMLYDNGELLALYASAYQRTGRDRYATVARETADFLRREFRHDDGGLFSTLDAQSEGEEGKFYVWRPDEVDAAIDDDRTASIARDRFGVTDAGNFEGKTVLTVSASIPDLADAYNCPESEIVDRLDDARNELFAVRSDRVRPARDEKILASWNGLAIRGLARAGLVLGDDAYVDLAADALSFVREHLWDAEAARLSRRYKDGDVKGTGYLDDYAFLARGAFELYGATGDVDHLAFAVELAEAIVDAFYDAEARTLYMTPEDGETLVTRPQELQDQSTPSSAGVAASLLVDLDAFAPSAGFADVADAVIDTHADRIRGRPLEHTSLALAAHRRAHGSTEVVVTTGDDTDAATATIGLPESIRASVASTYVPDGVTAPRPPTAAGLDSWLDALGLDEAPPIWRGREERDGEPTVYVCEGRACSPPSHSVSEALSWFETGDGPSRDEVEVDGEGLDTGDFPFDPD